MAFSLGEFILCGTQVELYSATLVTLQDIKEKAELTAQAALHSYSQCGEDSRAWMAAHALFVY